MKKKRRKSHSVTNFAFKVVRACHLMICLVIFFPLLVEVKTKQNCAIRK